MGKFLGLGKEKQGNIAGFALTIFLCLLAAELIWGGDTPTFSKKDAVTAIAGLITLTLGFVFGQKASSNSD